MSNLIHMMDPETYAKCEKAAHKAGFETVVDWLAFIITFKVEHTPFCDNR